MVVTASTKTGKHYFYIHVDGSDLSKSEILLFEGSTASITFTFQPSNHPVEGFNELHEKHRKMSGV